MKKMSAFLLLIFMIACSKNDQKNDTSPDPLVQLSDSSININQIKQQELNEFSFQYKINVPAGKSIDEATFLYSVKSDFSDSTNSVAIGTNIQSSKQDSLLVGNLPQDKRYFVKIKAKFLGKEYFSAIQEFKTDSLKINSISGKNSYPVYASKGQQVFVVTNFRKAPIAGGVTKIFLNNTQCNIIQENVNIISFEVPVSIQTGIYQLSVERNNLKTELPNAINILKGVWTTINQYPISPSNFSPVNALVDFGICQSPTKAYMVGGRNFNYVDSAGINVSFENYILEYDPSTHQWAKRYFTNPKYFENPVCFWFQDKIYVISGTQKNRTNGDASLISNMYRLDLSSMAWETVTPLPYEPRANALSFEYNNEIYFGMGNRQLPNPGPLNDFWKYNPATGVWTQLTSFPGTFYLYSSLFVNNNKAYLFFGKAGYNNEKELWEYDLSTNTWQQKTIALPPLNGLHYSVISHNNKSYFLTSEDYYYTLNGITWIINEPPCWEFDPITNNFIPISFPSPNVNIYKILFQSNNKIILVDNPKFTQIVSRNVVEFKPE